MAQIRMIDNIEESVGLSHSSKGRESWALKYSDSCGSINGPTHITILLGQTYITMYQRWNSNLWSDKKLKAEKM